MFIVHQSTCRLWKALWHDLTVSLPEGSIFFKLNFQNSKLERELYLVKIIYLGANISRSSWDENQHFLIEISILWNFLLFEVDFNLSRVDGNLKSFLQENQTLLKNSPLVLIVKARWMVKVEKLNHLAPALSTLARNMSRDDIYQREWKRAGARAVVCFVLSGRDDGWTPAKAF